MNHRIIALSLLALSGCVKADVMLGQGSESSGDSGEGMDESGDSSADSISSASLTSESNGSDPTSADSTSLDSDTLDSSTSTGSGAVPGVGAPCDHGVPAANVESILLTHPAPGCPGDVCLYADRAEPPQGSCNSDEACNVANPGIQRFVCALAEGVCQLDPEYLAAHSMCSGFCEDDSDCVTDEATNCVYGFSCEPQADLGESCCRPVCVCNDDLDEAEAEEIRLNCTFDQAPGCCDTLPGNGLCPD